MSLNGSSLTRIRGDGFGRGVVGQLQQQIDGAAKRRSIAAALRREVDLRDRRLAPVVEIIQSLGEMQDGVLVASLAAQFFERTTHGRGPDDVFRQIDAQADKGLGDVGRCAGQRLRRARHERATVQRNRRKGDQRTTRGQHRLGPKPSQDGQLPPIVAMRPPMGRDRPVSDRAGNKLMLPSAPLGQVDWRNARWQTHRNRPRTA